MDALPADCVRVALHDFRERIDWVLAGINAGGNLGVDIYYSGTVAAAREAAIHGLPAIAVSYYHDRLLTPEDWRRASAWLRPILADILARPAPPGVFWNVNLPCPPEASPPPRRPWSSAASIPLPCNWPYRSANGGYAYLRPLSAAGAQRGFRRGCLFRGGISLSRLELP